MEKERNQKLQHFHKVELMVACRKLTDTDFFSKADPFVRMWLGQGNKWRKIKDTEAARDTLDNDFYTTFEVNYIKDMHQEVVFEVLDKDSPVKEEIIGSAGSTLKQIMENDGKFTPLELHKVKFNPAVPYDYYDSSKSRGKIYVFWEYFGEARNMVTMEIHGKNLKDVETFSKSDPILRICRRMDEDKYLKIYESELIKDNLNPKWKEFTLPQSKFCSHPDKEVRFDVFDWNSNSPYKFMGSGSAKFRDIIERKASKIELSDGKSKKSAGTLEFSHVNVKKIPNFSDYLEMGTELHAMFAIDASIKDESAVSKIADSVLKYCSNHESVRVLSYGATSSELQKVENDCYVSAEKAQDMEGVLVAFQEAKAKTTPQEKKNLGPVIRESTKIAWDNKQAKNGAFLLTVVITSDKISDKDDILRMLKDSFYMPFSLVLIEVSDNDVDEFGFLIENDGKISNFHVEREIVEFLRWKDLKTTEAVEQAIFGEIPDMVVDYNVLSNIYPPEKNE